MHFELFSCHLFGVFFFSLNSMFKTEPKPYRMTDHQRNSDTERGDLSMNKIDENIVMEEQNANDITVEYSEETRVDGTSQRTDIFYGVTDNPPWPLAILLGFQVDTVQ